LHTFFRQWERGSDADELFVSKYQDFYGVSAWKKGLKGVLNPNFCPFSFELNKK